MKVSKNSKKGKARPCGVCGIGTHMGSEICVVCAQRLMEQPTRATTAKGAIPAPHVDERAVSEYLQMDFWAKWE